MIKVEVMKGYNEVKQRTIVAKSDGTPRVLYSQAAFLNKGGPFPIEFSLNIEGPSAAYPVGIFTLDLSCITVNKYGALQIDPYGVRLQPVHN